MSPEASNHTPEPLATQPEPAVVALADQVADAIASGAARPRIERELEDGTIESRPIEASPAEWKAGIHTAATWATSWAANRREARASEGGA